MVVYDFGCKGDVILVEVVMVSGLEEVLVVLENGVGCVVEFLDFFVGYGRVSEVLDVN